MKKAVYIAIGIDLNGHKDVLGMWVGENESAKFWATVLNSLKNRGVEDIFVACTGNLTRFNAAIHAAFPKTEIQNCIIHQLRNSSKYVSYKDLKALMADLKAVYAAVDEQVTSNIWTSLLRDGTRSILKSLSPGGITGLISAPILYSLNACSWKVIFSKRDNVYIYFDFIHLVSPCTLDLSILYISFYDFVHTICSWITRMYLFHKQERFSP